MVLHSGHGSRPAAWFTGIMALAMLGALGALLVASGRPVLTVVGYALGPLAVGCVPWQLLEARQRLHELTEEGLRCRSGVFGRFELEIPYRAVCGVSVRQAIWQRLLGCADVRVAAPGMSGAVLVTPRDYNSVLLRSIPDFHDVVRLLRERATRTANPAQA